MPVHVATGLTEAQIKAYRLMDNRSHQESIWDDSLLAIELGELRDLAVDLSITGFDAAEVDDLFALAVGKDGLTEDDAAPEVPEKPISRAGDLWICGSHRVLCGDATSSNDLRRLLGDQRADLVFTDPPYNVAYQGYTDQKLTIQGDKMDPGAFAAFLEHAFRIYREGVKPGALLYVCHASSCQREFQNAIESAGFEVRRQIIWAKNTFAWGHGRYKFQHEPIFYCHVAGQADAWYGDKSQSTLWQEKNLRPTGCIRQ